MKEQKRKLTKTEFLSMNETEREAWLRVPPKRFVFSIVNRWKQYSAYRIDFAPSLHVLKQLKSKSISIDWFGFCISLQINKLEKENDTGREEVSEILAMDESAEK